jgi:hypothetical protein
MNLRLCPFLLLLNAAACISFGDSKPLKNPKSTSELALNEITVDLSAQSYEDGKVGAQISGSAAPAASFNAHNTDAYFGDARRAAWWVEHADLGRLTVGRWESAGVLGTIDITGQIFLPASGSFILLNGGFFIRGNTGQYYATTWANIGDPASNNPGRTEGIRYGSNRL